MITIFGIPVIGPRLGVGIFNQFRQRYAGLPILRMERDVRGCQRQVIGCSAAHDRLVIIIGNRVMLGEMLEIGCVAAGNIVKTHGFAALEGMAWRQRIRIARARAGLAGDPHEHVAFAAIDLLPHLIKAVRRVAGMGAIADVVRDLERAVR